MQWGTDHEDEARELYIKEMGMHVDLIGFCLHDEYEKLGCSPDGIVGKDGLVEIKCPFNSDNHIAYCLNGIPDKYVPQVQYQMWITGRKWCDFVSYDPRMPEKTRIFIQRIKTDKEMHDQFLYRCVEFVNIMEEDIKKLESLGGFEV